jgi:hypothetical protein
MTPGIDALLNRARKVREDLSLPDTARTESRRDHRVVAINDPGIETSVVAALDWLGTAQDNSLSNDGGIALAIFARARMRARVAAGMGASRHGFTMAAH